MGIGHVRLQPKHHTNTHIYTHSILLQKILYCGSREKFKNQVDNVHSACWSVHWVCSGERTQSVPVGFWKDTASVSICPWFYFQSTAKWRYPHRTGLSKEWVHGSYISHLNMHLSNTCLRQFRLVEASINKIRKIRQDRMLLTLKEITVQRLQDIK